jgi:hemerythrin superfamily protein
MAAAKKSNGASSRSTNGNGKGKSMDAIALLKADHRKVEELFESYEKSKSSEDRQGSSSSRKSAQS